jgi:hypothetical protein
MQEMRVLLQNYQGIRSTTPEAVSISILNPRAVRKQTQCFLISIEDWDREWHPGGIQMMIIVRSLLHAAFR